MGVTSDEVRRIAELAALRLDPEEADRLRAELNGILDHVDVLSETEEAEEPDTEATEDTEVAPLRADEPGADGLVHRPAMMAPGWADGLFTVPRLSSHVRGTEGSTDPDGTAPGSEGEAGGRAP